MYDDKVREFIFRNGHRKHWQEIGQREKGEEEVTFDRPAMNLEVLLEYGKALENEQENVKRVQSADEYLDGAVLAGNDDTSNTMMSLN